MSDKNPKTAPAKKAQPQKQQPKKQPAKSAGKDSKKQVPLSQTRKTPNEVAHTKKEVPAVIFADSFDTFHRPLSLEVPRTLFPVCNISLLDYTIEFLISHGVIEIFVFCCAHAKQIQDHIDNHPITHSKDVSIKTVFYEKAMNEGDALRFLAGAHILRDDFILVNGDVVANIDIQAIVEQHRARRKKDKECVMTVVLREALPGHHTRANHDAIMAAINEETKQVVAFDPNPSARVLQVDKSQLGKRAHTALQFRYDLMDCRIAVCARDIVDQFRDNFDYTLLSQFIKGVVDEEILGAKIHASVIKGAQYAARVNCLRTYKAVSLDIMNRWAHPLVPDTNINGQTSFSCGMNRVYKDRDVVLSRCTSIGSCTMIGKGTNVGPNTRINATTIGSNCKIGDNCNISGSFLWHGVTIGDNVTITDSIVASDVTIGNGVTIGQGSVISYGVKIGPNIKLNSFTKLTLLQHKQANPIDLGKGGVGREWVDKNSVFGSELVPTENERKKDEESLSEDENNSKPALVYESGRKALLAAVFRCCKKLYSSGAYFSEASILNGTVDLMATKLAFDVSFVELVEAIILFILETAGPSNLVEQAQKNLEAWNSSFKRFLKGADQFQDEKELLYKIQDFCESHAAFGNSFPACVSIFLKTQTVGVAVVEDWLEDQEEEESGDLSEAAQQSIQAVAASLKEFQEQSDEITASDESQEEDQPGKAANSRAEDSSAVTGSDEEISWDDDDI